MLEKIAIISIYLLIVIIPTTLSLIFGFWQTAGSLIIFIVMSGIFKDMIRKNNNAK